MTSAAHRRVSSSWSSSRLAICAITSAAVPSATTDSAAEETTRRQLELSDDTGGDGAVGGGRAGEGHLSGDRDTTVEVWFGAGAAMTTVASGSSRVAAVGDPRVVAGDACRCVVQAAGDAATTAATTDAEGPALE